MNSRTDRFKLGCIATVNTRRSAYTLVELLVAMTVMSIVVGAAAGSLVIASRAIDDRQGSTARTIQTRDVTDAITADLRMALSFTEQNSDAVEFTVADRDGDNLPETIRYAWSSKDEILTRECNAKAPVIVARHVTAFNFDYLNRSVSPPPRPCCDGSGNCDMMAADLCVDGGGTPKSKNLTCDDNPCGGACCLGDGSCVETGQANCLVTELGSYHGDGTFCADVSCAAPLNVLLVVDDPANLDSIDDDRIALFESWGYTVNTLESDASQASFDLAVADADLVYVSCQSNIDAIGTKLNQATKGIVSEQRVMPLNLVMWQHRWDQQNSQAILIDDNTHYITSPYPTGLLVVLSEVNKMYKSKNDPAPGTGLLASQAADSSRTALAVVESGHQLVDGSRAAGRRVMLPWGTDVFTSSFNPEGLELMRRSMEWAAGAGDSQPRLLFVVTDAGSPTAQETARQALFESWDYKVELLTSSSNQAAYDTAVATTVVAYLSEELDSSDVGTKLTGATLGIVSEEVQLADEFGIAGDLIFKSRAAINVVDNGHYITSPFALGSLAVFKTIQPVHMLNAPYAPDLRILGESHNTGSGYKPSLAVLEPGDGLEGGGLAAGRRVELPWGGNDCDINQLTVDGQNLLRRAVDWAAGAN